VGRGPARGPARRDCQAAACAERNGRRPQGPFTSNPYKFDNHYFLETINYHQMPKSYPNNHLMYSDISQTFYGTRTFMALYKYAQNNTLFFEARSRSHRG
jgi:hypothetical protein